MKRLIFISVPILTLILLAGCSSDIESPSFTIYKNLHTPTSLVASYDKTTDIVDLSWDMADTTGVIDFFISMSDSSLIEKGNYYKSIPMGVDVSTTPYSYNYDASVYIPATVDSLIMYFTIAPVYQNDTFSSFIGPKAKADSAMVNRKE